jgi:hypothetical protein
MQVSFLSIIIFGIRHMILKGLAGDPPACLWRRLEYSRLALRRRPRQALTLVPERAEVGETCNAGGRNERTNLYVVEKICDLLDEIVPTMTGSRRGLISFVVDRPSHDCRYAFDASKIERELGGELKKISRAAQPRPRVGSATTGTGVSIFSTADIIARGLVSVNVATGPQQQLEHPCIFRSEAPDQNMVRHG